MGKRCLPGVICIENITLVFIILVVLFTIYFFYFIQSKQQPIIINSQNNDEQISRNGLFPKPSYTFSNIENDVLLNPYSAPLRDERVVQVPSHDVRGGIPINISTQAVDTNYRQVGILTRVNGVETILPLMGRPLYTSRDKWQFYAISDKNNNIKLPVSFKGKSCTNEYGCDDVSNGDTVYIEGYNDVFKVTLYDNATMKYIPFI